jgi:dipeptidyl aminopeptidase/acylaminoacyl peptidase
MWLRGLAVERYMGTPQNNPDGYASSSVMTHVANMTGKLFLVHGLIDENVHFRHTGTSFLLRFMLNTTIG